MGDPTTDPRNTPRIHDVGCHPLMVPGAGMCTCELEGEDG